MRSDWKFERKNFQFSFQELQLVELKKIKGECIIDAHFCNHCCNHCSRGQKEFPDPNNLLKGTPNTFYHLLDNAFSWSAGKNSD